MKREIIKKVALTEKDKDEYAIVEDQQAGKVTWDSKKDMEQPLVVEFSKQEIDYLKKSWKPLQSLLIQMTYGQQSRKSITQQMRKYLVS